MKALFKAALVAAALATTPSATAQATGTELAVARELAQLKAALREIEQAANEDARYVLPLRTNAQLAKLSAECEQEDGEMSQPICEPLPADPATGRAEAELMSF
ncbi:MAG: hypothetical protein KDJ69_04155 [Nitratireductor sp.]|nr:hypothetical protein [Nitratireductor sp.]